MHVKTALAMPPIRGAKYFLNVSENKSSDRKLSLIRSVRGVRLSCRIAMNFEDYENVLTPYIGTGINDIPLKHP